MCYYMYLVCIYVFTILCLYVYVYRYNKFYTRMYIFSYIARAIMCSVNMVKLSLSFVLKNGQCYFILYQYFPIISKNKLVVRIGLLIF